MKTAVLCVFAPLRELFSEQQRRQFLRYFRDRFFRQFAEVRSIAYPPIQTFHLIGKYDTCCRQTVGNLYLEWIAFYLCRDWA